MAREIHHAKNAFDLQQGNLTKCFKGTKFPALIWKSYIYLEITFNDAINICLIPIIVIKPHKIMKRSLNVNFPDVFNKQ